MITVCNSGALLCVGEKRCLPSSKVCNEYVDCENAEDELNCSKLNFINWGHLNVI